VEHHPMAPLKADIQAAPLVALAPKVDIQVDLALKVDIQVDLARCQCLIPVLAHILE